MIHLASPSVVKEILRSYKIRPAKSLGQNFLVDGNIIEKIISSCGLKKTDTVLEIGPGLGVLTVALAERVKKVIAVEIDPIMVDILKATTSGVSNVEIIHADILDFNFSDYRLPTTNYKLVSNLPYQITSPIFRLFLEEGPRPISIHVTIQKDMAQRVVARPPDANIMSNIVQFYGEPKILFDISAQSFWPVPDVTSSFLAINNISADRFNLNSAEQKQLFKIIRAGFGQKRKQLLNSLSAGLALPKDSVLNTLSVAGIDSKRRAETLTLKDWLQIAQKIA